MIKLKIFLFTTYIKIVKLMLSVFLILNCQQHFFLPALDMSKTKESHVTLPAAVFTSHCGELCEALNKEDGVFKYLFHDLRPCSIQMICSRIIHILCIFSCRAVYSLKDDEVALADKWHVEFCS